MTADLPMSILSTHVILSANSIGITALVVMVLVTALIHLAYTSGVEDGHTRGRREGINQGIDLGIENMESEVEDAYEEGVDCGLSIADERSAYLDGFEDGLDAPDGV